ncbi:MAG: ABC transporter permease [Actinomycetota bacterium]|nr:ABC transporter permease [Actinomycetota bacterium]MDA3013257.1 ABC transporter permease [Actinomycetota bacterium]
MLKTLKKNYLIFLPIAFIAVIAQVDKYDQLTTSGTFGAAIRLAIPICLAGLGGMFSERSGVVNIGLEGMMIMGTWFGAWAAWMYGPWYGILAGIIGGAMFGLIHAVGTVTFQVDHIVSGVAINILAAGVARFLNVVAYADQPTQSATQSPRIDGEVGDFTLPYLSGGGETPSLFGYLQDLDLPFLSDFAGLLLGATSNLSYISIFALTLIPIAAWTLWSTPFGLQMRSVGELPTGSESLGVNVYLMKYIGVMISGGFAGLAGAYLVLESSGIYREGQTAGRGFIGLASMIFGNYKPLGIFMGSGLFGYADALQLRSDDAVHGLLVLISLILLIISIKQIIEKKYLSASISIMLCLGFLIWFLNSETVPSEFVYFTPHITTLIVLSSASQKLRMPKKVGQPYRKGELN